MKTIKISDTADTTLSALSAFRKENCKIVKTKQDIIAELLAKAFINEIPVEQQAESIQKAIS